MCLASCFQSRPGWRCILEPDPNRCAPPAVWNRRRLCGSDGRRRAAPADPDGDHWTAASRGDAPKAAVRCPGGVGVDPGGHCADGRRLGTVDTDGVCRHPRAWVAGTGRGQPLAPLRPESGVRARSSLTTARRRPASSVLPNAPTTQLRSSASTAANTGEAQAQLMSHRGDLSETRAELGWIPPELTTGDAR